MKHIFRIPVLALCLCVGVLPARAQKPDLIAIPETEVREVPSSSGLHYYAYVHLPPDYHASDRRYPVLFLTDAEAYVYGMYTGIHHFLRADDEVRELILVGVADRGMPPEHFQRRRRDYTPTETTSYASQPGYVGSGGAGEFLRFLREEFVPFIEREYRTDPARRGLWGSSYGGLFAVYTLLHDPDLFSRYIIANPSL